VGRQRGADRRGRDHSHITPVGRATGPWYDNQRPDLFAAALRAAKPRGGSAGLLNPGVLIDPKIEKRLEHGLTQSSLLRFEAGVATERLHRT